MMAVEPGCSDLCVWVREAIEWAALGKGAAKHNRHCRRTGAGIHAHICSQKQLRYGVMCVVGCLVMMEASQAQCIGVGFVLFKFAVQLRFEVFLKQCWHGVCAL